MKKAIIFLILVILILPPIACSGTASGQDEAETSSAVISQTNSETISENSVREDIITDTDSIAEIDTMATIHLEDNSATIDGSGASIEDNVVTINSAGSYSISGTLDDGQIFVNVEDEGMVELVLNGVNITNSSGAPIYINSAETAVITLAAGTENTISDGAQYIFDDADTTEPDAAIFSNSDLVMNGDGSLTITANYKDGIASKDDLEILDGTITVSALADGIKGKDSVVIKDGVLTINAGSDGIQSTNAVDTEKGTVSIEGGTIIVIAGLDGIQAETNLAVSGGTIAITSGGGSANSSTAENQGNPGGERGMENNTDDTTVESTKGLKAGVDIIISGGMIQIDSFDDAVNSNNRVTINNGEILISSGDDGMHADAALEINDGTINITKSYEGLESAAITINGGTINLVASDDGINVAGGNDGSSMNGRSGQNNFADSGDYNLIINGGYIVIDAGGDGLDANGSIEMTDGKVIVYGPTNNGNGPLDYLGTFNISGGFIAAVGSSGMAQSLSTSSTQYSVLYNYSATQAGATLLHLESQDGEDILTLLPSKEYQSVLISSPDLKNGTTYNLYSGGSSSGINTDGLYAGGSYTSGSLVASFTISSIVTSEGTAGNMTGGGQGGRGGGPGGSGGMQPPAQ
jgi:hypothetical protein